MLRITTERKRGKVLLKIEGRLAGQAVAALQECWRELKTASPAQKFYLDLCAVSFIDQAGKVLLNDIHQQGGRLMADGCLNQAIVREIIEGDAKTTRGGRERAGKGTHIFFYGFLFFTLVLPSALSAQQTPAPAAVGVLRLSLDQAVGLALKQNTTARIAVLSAAQSEQQKNIARSALLPELALESSDSVHRANLETAFGTRIAGFPQHAGPFQVFSAGPSFGAPIFDLTLWRRYQAAKDNAAATRASSYSTREQVVL